MLLLKEQSFKKTEKKKRGGKAANRWQAESALLIPGGAPGPLRTSAAGPVSTATKLLTLRVTGDNTHGILVAQPRD